MLYCKWREQVSLLFREWRLYRLVMKMRLKTHELVICKPRRSRALLEMKRTLKLVLLQSEGSRALVI